MAGVEGFLGFEPTTVVDEVSNSLHDCTPLPSPPERISAMGAFLMTGLCARKIFLLTRLCARELCCSDICDAADAMEATLAQHSDMQDARGEIKQARATPSLPEAARHLCASHPPC